VTGLYSSTEANQNDFMRLHSDTHSLRSSAALAAPVPFGTDWRVSVRTSAMPYVGGFNPLPYHQYALVRRPMR
jgi:hypothetical protein